MVVQRPGQRPPLAGTQLLQPLLARQRLNLQWRSNTRSRAREEEHIAASEVRGREQAGEEEQRHVGLRCTDAAGQLAAEQRAAGRESCTDSDRPQQKHSRRGKRSASSQRTSFLASLAVLAAWRLAAKLRLPSPRAPPLAPPDPAPAPGPAPAATPAPAPVPAAAPAPATAPSPASASACSAASSHLRMCAAHCCPSRMATEAARQLRSSSSLNPSTPSCPSRSAFSSDECIQVAEEAEPAPHGLTAAVTCSARWRDGPA